MEEGAEWLEMGKGTHMVFLALLLLCGPPVAVPPMPPHAQSADEAGAPAEDISLSPAKKFDRLVSRTCGPRHVCTERFESRAEPKGETGVLVIRRGAEVELLAPSDYVPRSK